MLAVYGGFWSEWEANEKVDFDGANSVITVYPHVTTIDIRADVWSAAVRWLAIVGRGNDRWLEPMDRTGLDPIPNGVTGDSYFLINGWKLVVDFSKVKVTGVLFSRDYDTAYYTSELTPQYAAEVSSIVNVLQVGSGLSDEQDAQLNSLDTTNLDASISSIATLINALATLEPDERAKLLSLDNTDLTGTNTKIDDVQTSVDALPTTAGLTQEQHDRLMESASTVDTIVASQL